MVGEAVNNEFNSQSVPIVVHNEDETFLFSKQAEITLQENVSSFNDFDDSVAVVSAQLHSESER